MITENTGSQPHSLDLNAAFFQMIGFGLGQDF